MTLRKPKKQKGGNQQKKPVPVLAPAFPISSDDEAEDGQESKVDSDPHTQVSVVQNERIASC